MTLNSIFQSVVGFIP